MCVLCATAENGVLVKISSAVKLKGIPTNVGLPNQYTVTVWISQLDLQVSFQSRTLDAERPTGRIEWQLTASDVSEQHVKERSVHEDSE